MLVQRIVRNCVWCNRSKQNNYYYFKVFAVQQKADRENENNDEQTKLLRQDTSGQWQLPTQVADFYMYQQISRWHLSEATLCKIIE